MAMPIRVRRLATAARSMPSITLIQREAQRPCTAMKPPVNQKPIGA